MYEKRVGHALPLCAVCGTHIAVSIPSFSVLSNPKKYFQPILVSTVPSTYGLQFKSPRNRRSHNLFDFRGLALDRRLCANSAAVPAKQVN
jgi:hypothetical protein